MTVAPFNFSNMMVKSPFKIAFLTLFFFCKALNAAGLPEKRRLPLGETIRLAMPGVDRVRLSRDGIVLARHGTGNEWLLTGMARGVVLVHPEGVASGERELVIEVFSPAARAASVVSSKKINQAHALPGPKSEYGCDTAMEKFGAFQFLVSMSSRRKAMEAGVSPRINLTAQGNFESNGKSLSLARAVIGVGTSDVSGRMDSKVIARPRMVLFPGVESVVRSGGEFKTESPVFPFSHGGGNQGGIFPGRLDVWKEYGLAIRAKWTECINEKAVVEFEVSVTQRMSGGEHHLLAGRISGKRAIGVGVKAFGGAVEFASGAHSRSGSYFLEGIPILGPLLSRRDDEDGDATMTVWVEGLDDSIAGDGFSSTEAQGSKVDSGSSSDDGAGEGVDR